MPKGKQHSSIDENTRGLSSRFAVAIRNARERKGISLNKLGEITKTSASYINRLEKFERKNPSATILITLAQALDINVWELLKLAYDEDHADKAYDVADLFLSSNFPIDDVVVKSTELRKTLMDIVLMVVYQLDEDVNYRDIVPLIDLIKKFHQEKQDMLIDGD